MADRPSVSVAVMAHPKRASFVAELVDQLDRPTKVVWDERQDRWDTGRRAMLAYDPAASHHLVVQDDAIVCRDLIAGVERALAHVPAPPGVPTPLCLYIGKVTPYHTQVTHLVADAGVDASWLTMGGVFWGVAIVMPTELIEPMVAWGDGRGRYIANYDKRIGTWLDNQKITTWYPWPNLVDHRDSPSLVSRNRVSGRHAHRFVGRDVSALDLDWSGGVVHVPSIRNYQGHRPRRALPDRGDLIMRAKNTGNAATSSDLMTPRGVNTRTLRLVGAAGVPAEMQRRHKLIPGVTVAHADSWIVRYRPEIWTPLVIDYPDDTVNEAEGAGPPVTIQVQGQVADTTELTETMRKAIGNTPGNVDGGDTGEQAAQDDSPDSDLAGTSEPAAPKPAAKDVRAWAKAEGIEVPTRGPLPDDVVDRYQAAHPVTEW